MSETVISIRGIGKRYRLGALKGFYSYRTLRDTVSGIISSIFGSKEGASPSAASQAFFWALKDVSCEISRGDTVGLIGRNGAGKTTLLKVLSQITEPTEGEARIRGRVASLLEVGHGFHPELTGRENIFMNGAILGMTRAEIIRKFDEIVAFAEIEKFLDTPVKRYSSGMYVRLAFSVAAHLEPEILLVDEVLAVGDASFQKKCLGKMGDVTRKEGRTLLFVSHNMAAVNTLCSRAILLQQGRIIKDGPTSEVTTAYHTNSVAAAADRRDLGDVPRHGTGKAKFLWIDIKPQSADGKPLDAVFSGCDLAVETLIECHEEINDANAAVTIYDPNGFRLVDANIAQKGFLLNMKPGEKRLLTFGLREVLLKEGTYFIGLWVGKGKPYEPSLWFPAEDMDDIELATTLTIAERFEERECGDIFPGPYVCRFDVRVSDRTE